MKKYVRGMGKHNFLGPHFFFWFKTKFLLVIISLVTIYFQMWWAVGSRKKILVGWGHLPT